jgi:serine/threonine protein kinase
MLIPESNETTKTTIVNLSQSSVELQPDQLLGGKYRVISLLGKGGMGIVYRVEQILLCKELALKTIDKRLLSDVTIRRFQQEAKAAFAVQHPNIIAVNDFGLLDDQTPFLVMEIINGETLGERIKRTGRLNIDQAIPIFVQACFGLGYAHDHGIVHRDVKPNNIMLLDELPSAAEGAVKIVDFGIAKFGQHDGGEIQALTRTGEIFGSPLYMSPEQCTGERVDHRADIYSLGCVMFEALTGTPPFIGENAIKTMLMHQTEIAPSLKEASLGENFPQALEELVAMMLAKSPENRYQSLGKVAQALGAFQRGDTIPKSTLSVNTPPQPVRGISLTRTALCALLIGTASLSGASGYLLHDLKGAMETRQEGRVEPSAEESGIYSKPEIAFGDAEAAPELSDKMLENKLAEKKREGTTFAVSERTLKDHQLKQITSALWIKELSLSACEIANESLWRLANLRLRRIDLDHSNLTDSGVEGLAKCNGLQDISVNQTKVTDKGIKRLAAMKGLQRLALSNTALTDKGLVELSKSESLNYVKFDRTLVTFGGIEQFCRNSKNCKTVLIRQCQNINSKHFEQLKREFPNV